MDHGQLHYQLQILEMQKQQATAQLEELKQTMEELEKAKGKVFQFHGMLLIESSKKNAKDKLDELHGMLESRMKAIDMQLERLGKVLEEAHKKEKGAHKEEKKE